MTATAPVASRSLIPPEEKFWQRYSPHHEAPLSGITSTVIHALVIALLLLIVYVHSITKLDDATRPVPVDVMKVGSGKGGQVPAGGVGPGGGDPIDREGGGDRRVEPPSVPPLTASQTQGVKEQFPDDPIAEHYLKKGGSTPAFDFLGLQKEAMQTLRKGLKPGVGGGPSKDRAGGSDDGLTRIDPRLARALRWDITFNTRDGNDYLAQLAGLGAKIGIPIEGKEGQFLLVDDLKNPTAAVKRDVATLGLIYWIDKKPASVQSLFSVVPHHQPSQPSYFVAFFPRKLEDRMLDLEMDAAARMFNIRDEDRIHLTQFEVFRSGTGHDIRVKAVFPKQR
jgi:hypothetical protein